MERSYYCAEQVYQMQATYDGFVLCKIAHEAGVDMVSNPIDYFCNHFGEQSDVFWECMKRIFGEIEHTGEGLDEYSYEQNTYKVPLPELNEFYMFLSEEEKGKYVQKFNKMLTISDDFSCEFEMEGVMAGNCFYITLHGGYGCYSPFLEKMVEIRNEVREVIRARKALIVNQLRNVVLLKLVYDRLGVVVESAMEDHVNVVFSRIMERCSNLSVALSPGDSFSFDSMLSMLNQSLDNQVAIQIKRGEVAA
ncbi:hypothetical protein [Cohnella soli]|uniref:Uncharacterized protein n=1 Tax=Cohnella soli TaxID=425005 RepID=A0ABW0HQ90_9BACL